MALKLPGYEWWPLDGVPGIPFDEWDDPKALVHTTQGTSIDGAVSAYRSYPPHLIVDPWRRHKVQHVDLERGAYALWNADADDSRCYQIEIVGFAEDAPDWPDDALRWLGEEVALPLHEYCGVPYRVVWKGFKSPADVNYILASPDSPLRLTQAELDSFSGWLGHQHIPGDSHWDPSGLNVPKILAYAQEKNVMNADQDKRLRNIEEFLQMIATNQWRAFKPGQPRNGPGAGGDLSWLEAKIAAGLAPLTAKVDALAGTLSDDEAKIVAAIRAQPTGGQVDVAALAPALATALVPLLPPGIDVSDVEQALANVLTGGTDEVPDA